MPIVAHLVEKAVSGGENEIIDGVRAMILAIDDTVDTTNALIQARGVTVAKAAGIPLPDSYFTSNRAIATTWDAAGDHTIFSGQNVAETIA